MWDAAGVVDSSCVRSDPPKDEQSRAEDSLKRDYGDEIADSYFAATAETLGR